MTRKEKKRRLKKQSAFAGYQAYDCPDEADYLSQPDLKHGSWSIHAEQAVMRGLPKTILRRARMIVIRIDQRGELKSSKPCPRCQKMLHKVGISSVRHS